MAMRTSRNMSDPPVQLRLAPVSLTWIGRSSLRSMMAQVHGIH